MSLHLEIVWLILMIVQQEISDQIYHVILVPAVNNVSYNVPNVFQNQIFARSRYRLAIDKQSLTLQKSDHWL